MIKRPLQFVVSETYESWTPEDIELGDTDDKGFLFEDWGYDVDELKEHLKREGYTHLSQSHVAADTRGLWISNESETTDYGTGEETTKSLHCKQVCDGDGKEIKPALAARAWNKVLCEAAGVKMQQRPPAMSMG